MAAEVLAPPAKAPAALARSWLRGTLAVTAGGFLAAIALAPPANAAPTRALGWLLFTGSSVHVAATGWLFTQREVRAHAARHRFRFVVAPALLLLTAAIAAVALPVAQMSWLLLPFFCWQFFHFQKQNLGMTALAAASHGVPPPRPPERRALMTAGLAGIGGLIARPALLQIKLPSLASALFVPSGLVLAGAVACGSVAVLTRAPAERPAGFCAMYLLSLCFPVPIFCFASPYAALGGMTIAHGLQYLLLVTLVAAGGPGRPATRLAVLGNIALVGGLLLAGASHLHTAGASLRFVFGLYLGVLMTHFVADAGLWRLRDPFPRAFMTARVPYLLRPVDRPPI